MIKGEKQFLTWVYLKMYIFDYVIVRTDWIDWMNYLITLVKETNMIEIYKPSIIFFICACKYILLASGVILYKTVMHV